MSPRALDRRRSLLPLALLAGDVLVVFAAFCVAWVLRYASPLGRLGIPVPGARFADYLPLLLLGTAFLTAAYLQQDLYSERLLLRKLRSLGLIFRGTVLWLAGYLALSLVLRFEPPISRWFVILATVSVLAFMSAWRSAVYAWLTRPGRVERLQRRTIVLGWTPDAAALVADLRRSPTHPLRPVGWIRLPGDGPGPADCPELGALNNLPRILREERIDAVIAARTDLPAADLRFVLETCEAGFVDWKVVPSSFQILTSGLRLETVGRVPILGVEDLAIHRPLNRVVKRTFDLVGASVGLLLSLPWTAILSLLIRRESPGAPALFAQQRVGARQRPFVLYKLRSMHPEAAAADHLHQSTPANDPRLLRIGAWMRRWNLDELPQFWNVLKGDMSLVGPRPERPAHVARLSAEIPHYLPRHLVKPGLTGWAQVNGLRGEGDLVRRIQHDIAYIENWSLLGDVQILLLTFLRWKNPAA